MTLSLCRLYTSFAQPVAALNCTSAETPVRPVPDAPASDEAGLGGTALSVVITLSSALPVEALTRNARTSVGPDQPFRLSCRLQGDSPTFGSVPVWRPRAPVDTGLCQRAACSLEVGNLLLTSPTHKFSDVRIPEGLLLPKSLVLYPSATCGFARLSLAGVHLTSGFWRCQLFDSAALA